MPARQTLRFCTSPDGTRIAIASIGSGPPLVRAAHWLSHVEYDLQSPVWRPWLTELSRDHSYVRYDQRGCGLSDREVVDLSLDAWVSDLEAVVDSLGLKRFPLFGMSQGGCGSDHLCGTPSGTGVALGFFGRLCARCTTPRRQ